MNPGQLLERLRAVAGSPHFVAEAYDIVDELTEAGADLDSVITILQFLEEHPEEDIGAPGPLVHFMEGFAGRGYEEELLKSLARGPMWNTVGMMMRVLNGEKVADRRNRCLEALRAAHAAADGNLRKRIQEVLDQSCC